MRNLYLIIIIIFSCVAGVYFYDTQTSNLQYKNNNGDYCNTLFNYFGININYNVTYNNNTDDDFTYMQHHVKFHIYPDEREGINVSIKMSDDCFQNSKVITKYTDNNSEVTFPMISSAKYNILIDDNRCSYYIYPVESYYKITCGG